MIDNDDVLVDSFTSNCCKGNHTDQLCCGGIGGAERVVDASVQAGTAKCLLRAFLPECLILNGGLHQDYMLHAQARSSAAATHLGCIVIAVPHKKLIYQADQRSGYVYIAFKTVDVHAHCHNRSFDGSASAYHSADIDGGHPS
jgi:hypothetical protein